MKRFFLLLCLCYACAGIPQVAIAQLPIVRPSSHDRDSAVIAALEHRIEEAVTRRNVVFLDSVYAPTFRFKHSTGTLELREKRLANLRRPQAPTAPGRTISRSVDSMDVEIHGNVALSTGRIHVLREGGNPRWQNYTVRYARVWERSGPTGRWRLLTHHTTSESEGPPARQVTASEVGTR